MLEVAECKSAKVAAETDRLLAMVDDLDGVEASELLLEVPGLIAKLDSLRLALVSRVDDSGVWREDPNGTLQSFLRRLHQRDHRESVGDVRAADFLKAFPRARQAASGGRLSRAHVDVLVAVGLRTQQRRDMLGDFLHIFLDIAATSPASVLRTVMRKWACRLIRCLMLRMR